MYFPLVLKTQFLKSGSLDGKFGMENRLLETAFKKIFVAQQMENVGIQMV